MKKFTLFVVIAIALITTIGYTSLAMAGINGLVEVVTDKDVYSPTEPIHVMAKFTNSGTEGAALIYPPPGGLWAYASVIEAKANGKLKYNGAMRKTYLTSSTGCVNGFSSAMPLYLKIPALNLAPGAYSVIIVFQVNSTTDVLFNAQSEKVIIVK